MSGPGLDYGLVRGTSLPATFIHLRVPYVSALGECTPSPEVPENPSSSSNFRSLFVDSYSKIKNDIEAPFVIFTHLSFGFCCTHNGIVEQASGTFSFSGDPHRIFS